MASLEVHFYWDTLYNYLITLEKRYRTTLEFCNPKQTMKHVRGKVKYYFADFFLKGVSDFFAIFLWNLLLQNV